MNKLSPQILVTMLCMLLLVACGSNPTPKRTSLAAEIRASTLANPDATGRPSPVVVYVLSLRSIDRFQSTQLVDILDGPATALAADLVSFRQMTILPGETKTTEVDTTPETRFVAAVAALQNYSNLRWRDSVEISDTLLPALFKSNKASIEVDQSGIHILRK